MTLFVLSYLAGVLTILAPCVLPVLPFVFARADRPFTHGGLPMLAGMAVSFVAVATLATVGGGWVAEANEVGRGAAIAALAVAGLALLLPTWAERWSRPLVQWGARLSDVATRGSNGLAGSAWSSAVLGVATGLLWAPCAGPVLGLVLSASALQGASARTVLLLAAYAAGAATSLAAALWTGGRVFATMRRALGLGEWLRRGLGLAVLAAVAAIALGLDTSVLAGLSSPHTDDLENALLKRWHPQPSAAAAPAFRQVSARNVAPIRTAEARNQERGAPTPANLPVEGRLPALTGATTWLNSKPLTAAELRGKVVLIDFWTFGCINCRHALPYVRAWADKYKDQGLVVIGVHSPEFAYERKIDNVQRAARDLGLTFPIAVDNDFAIWKAFSNRYWPAHYFIDARGRIRFHKFGEGEYERSEQVIQELLDEAGSAATDAAV